ncbi:MAG: hypothetical protein K6G17_09005 [Oscillospiraceae bacterium]|nr:hypothetical protein [Oscillospiraceae bacterium]
MDDLEGQIRQVLNDPGQMAQIMNLAQSLMGGDGEKPPASPAEEPGAESALLSRLASLMSRGGESRQQALMKAIEPYLSEKRRQKMERALRLARMARLARLAMEGMEGTDDA